MEQLDDVLGLHLPMAVLLTGRERVVGMEVPWGPAGITSGQAGGKRGAWATRPGPSWVLRLVSQVPPLCASTASPVRAGEGWAASLPPYGERAKIWDL